MEALQRVGELYAFERKIRVQSPQVRRPAQRVGSPEACEVAQLVH